MKLFDAAKDGNVDELESLIKAGGCDLQQRDHNGRTILHIAVQYGQAEFIRALDEHFLASDFNLFDFRGTTATTLAVAGNQIEALSALFDIGVDLSVPDQTSITPATAAASNGKVEIINLLHSKSIDLSAKDGCGKTPAHWAAEYGHANVIHALKVLGIPLDTPDEQHKKTPLCFAAEDGHVDAVNALISYGSDTNKYAEYNRTPLMYAARSGSVDVIKSLLEAGANLNLLDNSHRSVLHHAALSRRTLCVAYLLKLDAFKINATDSWGQTPLHLALGHGCDIDLVKLLYENKADVNAKNNLGSTPLHEAMIRRVETKVIAFLLQHGADINKCQISLAGEHLSAISSAREGRHFQIIPFLYRNGASIDKLNDDDILFLFEKAEELFHEKLAAPHLELMRLLLKLWPILPLYQNEIIDPTLLPCRLKIQQQLADEQTSLKLIDQSLRHDPHSFFGYLPKDVFEYVIKPMVEDFSVDPLTPLSFSPPDYSSSDDEDVVPPYNGDLHVPDYYDLSSEENDSHVTSRAFAN